MSKLSLVSGALMALVFALAVPPDASAQWWLAPHGGANLDAEEFYFGVDARIPLPAAQINGTAIQLNPGFDYYPFFGSSGTSASFWMVNLDVVYPFPSGTVQPFVGSGLFISRASVDVLGESVGNTDVGLNLKGGALFGTAGTPQPFGEFVLGLGDDTMVALRGGVQIPIGGP